MFYNLPVELQDRIYDFSGNFKEEYEKSLSILKRFPKLIDFKILNNTVIYYFYSWGWACVSIKNISITEKKYWGLMAAYRIALRSRFNAKEIKQIRI